MPASQIDDDAFLRLRTADQQVPGGSLIERFGSITHRTGNQAALAIVANARTARPTNGNVAGFRELEQILIFCIPSNSEAATRKRDLRPLARGSCRRMNWARSFSSYARRQGFTRAEDFFMYAVSSDAPGSESRAQIIEKCRWSTQVNVCVMRHTKFFEHGYAETSGSIKFDTHTILG